MNFRELATFRAVLDAGSATAAARVLGLSQPAVSRQLHSIESLLGLQLLVRERGKLVPTEHAKALYEELAFALEGVERVLNLAAKLRGHESGTLAIAAPFSFCEVLVPQVVARLARVHPNLRYAVESATYPAILSMIAKREVDVGILKEPVSHAGVTTLPLIRSEAVCAMPAGHRLARLRRVSVADIAKESLVLLGRNTPWRREIYALIEKAGRTPTVRLDSHSVGAACGFVANGLGLSIVPGLLGAQFAYRGVVLRPLADAIEHRFVLGVPKGARRSALVAEFVQHARATAREAMRRVMSSVPDERT